MKVFASCLLISFFSTIVSADESCLKVKISKEDSQFICRHADVESLNLFSLHDVETCFIGSAQMLTDKINAGLFNNSHEGIADAEKINGYQLNITFWRTGKTHKKSVFKCE